MKELKILCATFPWECECCGLGEHVAVSVYEGTGSILWRGSKNDQFGGPLNEGDNALGLFYDVDDYLKGMRDAFEIQGYKVTVYINGKEF